MRLECHFFLRQCSPSKWQRTYFADILILITLHDVEVLHLAITSLAGLQQLMGPSQLPTTTRPEAMPT